MLMGAATLLKPLTVEIGESLLFFDSLRSRPVYDCFDFGHIHLQHLTSSLGKRWLVHLGISQLSQTVDCLAFVAFRQVLQWGGMDQNAIFLHNCLQLFIYHVLKDLFYERLENWCSVGQTKRHHLVFRISQADEGSLSFFLSVDTDEIIDKAVIELRENVTSIICSVDAITRGRGYGNLLHWVLCSLYMARDYYPFSPQREKLQQVR